VLKRINTVPAFLFNQDLVGPGKVRTEINFAADN